jgi:hypothetical protein
MGGMTGKKGQGNGVRPKNIRNFNIGLGITPECNYPLCTL